MKAVFTQYWNSSGNFGFIDFETYLWSQTLSVVLAKHQFDKLELVCNNMASHFLIERLGLPFDEVKTILDSNKYLDNITHSCFTIPKIIAYSIQTSPFIHIDNDLFLYDILTEEHLAYPFFGWCTEPYNDFYKIGLKILSNYIPIKTVDSIINTGIFVVNDIKTKDEYCHTVFGILDKFIESPVTLSPLTYYNDCHAFSVSLEQLYLSNLLQEKNIKYSAIAHDKTVQECVALSKSFHFISYVKRDLMMSAFIKNRAVMQCAQYHKKIRDIVAENDNQEDRKSK